MRTGRIAALGLLLTLAAAGCAGDDDNGTKVASARTGATATASTAPSAAAAADEDAALKFAQCMRANGMTWFPDPQPGGRMMIKTPKGLDPAKFEAAQQACKQYAPNGGERPAPDSEMLEQARQMAKCMRANGVPDFPDPQPDGSMRLDARELGSGPGDPAFDKAEQKCSQHMPGAVSGREQAPA